MTTRTLRIDFTAQLNGTLDITVDDEDTSSRELTVAALAKLLPAGLTVDEDREAVRVYDVAEIDPAAL